MIKRIYSSLLNPSLYPDFCRRPNRVPTWELFDRITQFTTLRAFTIKDNVLVNFREDLDLYQRLNLGRVIWPVFQTVFAHNFNELVDEIKRRGLFLFDIWGHVPGSGHEGMWSHDMPPQGMVEDLQQKLGDRFLGFANGEQDGRYVAGYATQQCPAFAHRFDQFLNFQRHFQRMGDDLGNKLTTLVSLCFGHYFLKEGNHVLIGAETAQALPNSQIYYAFIRGAGKQYGVHWFGNASVWNRWGYKSYETEGEACGAQCGPTHGTSLSLLRRLIYTHYLYNCVAIGFELSWLMGDNTKRRIVDQSVPLDSSVPMGADRETAVLSPVGEIQASTAEFVQKNGQPGVMVAPVALLLDHYSGWTVPRHLYTGKIYQVWGAMPYAPGDYFTHGVLSTMYPHYEDAGYFRDERGFLAATPYGDAADVLLSDAPDWVMMQYNVIVAAGKLNVDIELRAQLDAFVAQGGHLVVTADNARTLWPELLIGPPTPTSAQTGAVVTWPDGSETTEHGSIPACPANLPAGATILARCGDVALAARFAKGAGHITLLLTPFGLSDRPTGPETVPNEVEKTLANPYPLLTHVGKVLDDLFSAQRLFSVGSGLGYITCRKDPGDYTLGVFNPAWNERPFDIVSHCGRILKISELPIDQRAKSALGYWPTGMDRHNGGKSSLAMIAGGDIRLFQVLVQEEDVHTIPPVAPPPPVKDSFLAIRRARDVKEAILAHPTFFRYFDGITLDWEYLRDRDRQRIVYERGWLARQKVRIVVDFSHGLNFYPDLTLLDTLPFRYQESLAAIDDVLDKMGLLGATGAMISLHRKPENHCDDARATDRFLYGVRELCRRAEQRGIVIHLQAHPHKWLESTVAAFDFIKRVGANNLRFALNTAHLAMKGEDIGEAINLAGDQLGLVLLSAPVFDTYGQAYDAHAPIHTGRLDLGLFRNVRTPMVLDADYRAWDDVYRDIRLLPK